MFILFCFLKLNLVFYFLLHLFGFGCAGRKAQKNKIYFDVFSGLCLWWIHNINVQKNPKQTTAERSCAKKPENSLVMSHAWWTLLQARVMQPNIKCYLLQDLVPRLLRNKKLDSVPPKVPCLKVFNTSRCNE